MSVVGAPRVLGMPLAAVSPPDEYPVPKDGQKGFAQEYTSSRDELERLRLLRRKERMDVEHRQYRTEVLGRVVIIAGAFVGGWAALWYAGRGLSGFSSYWLPTALIFTLVVAVVAIADGMALGRRHDRTLLDIDKGADEMVDHHQERMMEYRRREEEIYRERDDRILEKQKADWEAILAAEQLKLEREKLQSAIDIRRAKIQAAQDIEEKKIEVEVQKVKDATMLAQRRDEARAALAARKTELAAKKAEAAAEVARQRAETLALQREKLKAAETKLKVSASRMPRGAKKVEVTTPPPPSPPPQVNVVVNPPAGGSSKSEKSASSD